jgi:ABC-2 type transport system permease protein
MSIDPAIAPTADFCPPRSRGSSSHLTPGSLAWFAQHELRLAVRDWFKAGQGLQRAIGAVLVIVAMHVVGLAIAVGVPAPDAYRDGTTQIALLILMSFAVLSLLAMMIAQSMETVTRAFYARGDLDLILSSPASPRRVFAVRMVATMLTTLSLSGFLVLPVVNMLVVLNDLRWATIYGVMLAVAMLGQSIAILVTMGLFRLIGAKRARLTAQIIAALVGAAIVIATQVPVILQSGRFSRMEFLHDPTVLARLPDPSSLVWLPARAAHGDVVALVELMAACCLVFACTIAVCSYDFARMVVSAAGVSETQRPARKAKAFALRSSPGRVLRLKEVRLILRDPWLISQSLTQILYLIPAALLLWRNFGASSGNLAVLVPVVVMAAAQLAGGLAWLALTAEDAPDLIASAPIATSLVLRSKVEAVVIAVGVIVGPVLIAIGIAAPMLAATGALFAAFGIAGNTFVQYAFRSEAKRSQFRHRQRSSRMATLSETLCSVAWAAASGLAASGNGLFLLPTLMALAMLLLCRLVGPAYRKQR